MLFKLILLFSCCLFFISSCNNPLVPGGDSSVLITPPINSPQKFNLEIVSLGDSSVSVKWTDSIFATSYAVMFRHPLEGTYKIFSTSAVSPTILIGLENGSNYSFMVVASNSNGFINSNVIQAVPSSTQNVPVISYIGSTGLIGNFGIPMSVSPSKLESSGSPITSCSVSPLLPAWASINASTCVISGTPTAILAPTIFSVTASNSVGTSVASVTLSVSPSAPFISFLGSLGTNGAVGIPMIVQPTLLSHNGALINLCIVTPSLPIGLSLNNETCVISGTPLSSLPITIFSITSSNSVGSGSATIALVVAASVPIISFTLAEGSVGKVGVFFKVSPTTLDGRGATIATCTVVPSLPSWASIDGLTCIISGTPTAILTSTTYSVTASNSVGSSVANVTLSVSASGPSLHYSPGTVNGKIGVAMTVSPSKLDSSGSPITSCTVVPSLPSWASIDGLTCIISGTPTAILASTIYAVTASNVLGSSVASVALSVSASAPVLNYSAETFNGKVGVSLSVSPSRLDNSGSPITSCTVSPSLAVWASIDALTCVITGTPTAILAPTIFAVAASNSVGTSIATITLSASASAPMLNYSSATINGNVGVALTVSPSKFDSSGSPITSCTVAPSLPAWASIDASTCVIVGTPSTGLTQTIFMVTASNSVGSTSSSFTLFVASQVCPLNFVRVPANVSLGVVSDFCVAKYEMKNHAGVATSQPSGMPWVSISQSDAQASCLKLGSRYDLISNPEWMAVAHSIEMTKTNWTNSFVGSGTIYRGHSDNSPNSLLAVTDESDTYFGTGNTTNQASGSGKEQRRTLNLSNSEVVWDFSGNAWEWTDWSLGGGLEKGPTTCGSSWFQIPLLNCGALVSNDYLPANPGNIASSSYNSIYGLGQILVGSGGAALRGGNLAFGSRSGIFSLSLADTGKANIYNGFRCVYRPF